MSFTINGTTGINLGTEPFTGQLPDANAPSGSVIQVVSVVYDGSFSSSSSTYADTGLTATITPSFSTSKILVMVVHANLYKDDDGSGAAINIRLVKDGSTVIKTFVEGAAFTGTVSKNGVAGTSYTYLDSPATTSSVTYKTQMANRGASGTVVIQANANTLTLMEITA